MQQFSPNYLFGPDYTKFPIFLTSSKAIREAKQTAGKSNDVFRDLHMFSNYADMHFSSDEQGVHIPLHSHYFWELLYCFEGNIEYLMGTRRYRVQAGDIVVIPPNVSHQPLLAEHLELPYRRAILWLNEEITTLSPDEWPNYKRRESYLLRTAGTRWEMLADYFRRGCLEAEAANANHKLYLLGNALCICALINRAMTECASLAAPAKKTTLLDDIVAYIEEHLADKITLAETARHFLVSESTVGKIFRAQMDVSFYRYVVRRRLLMAKALIQEDIPLDEIYGQVGFGDYSSFYRAFKQEFDLSPNQYRSIFPRILTGEDK